MIYTNDNNESFDLNASAYQDYKSNGNDLLQTTNEKSYNTWMDVTFKELGKDYDTHETTIKEFREYKYKLDENNNPSDICLDSANHSVDAVRYALSYALRGAVTIR